MLHCAKRAVENLLDLQEIHKSNDHADLFPSWPVLQDDLPVKPMDISLGSKIRLVIALFLKYKHTIKISTYLGSTLNISDKTS